MPLVMEIKVKGQTHFVCQHTAEQCRKRAKALFGEFEEVSVKAQKEVLNVR